MENEEVLRTEKDEKQDAQQLANVGIRISARKSNLSLMENL